MLYVFYQNNQTSTSLHHYHYLKPIPILGLFYLLFSQPIDSVDLPRTGSFLSFRLYLPRPFLRKVFTNHFLKQHSFQSFAEYLLFSKMYTFPCWSCLSVYHNINSVGIRTFLTYYCHFSPL